ncbi:hypothetical protein A6P39_020670 [Streptomyces sp. FXJ1.172]|uniref:wHTH domain-containing protein n=1 Tax=Streptomyces sp. FXJ1.172 TaxID=710705 RepID=UPI0007CF6394|nr:hypothetical protein [Streptomyces sp. FXJ1.172]WEO96248.1 hypothetical protein A6P39_020670 [Streptomyces sp. FXJ1.172]
MTDHSVQDAWRQDVEDCLAWKSARPEGRERAEALKGEAWKVTGRLAELYVSARDSLLDDPWHDPDLARRTARRTNQLIHWLRQDTHEAEGFLAPGEAALLALLPFLHQVHRARTSAGLSHVDPTDLGRQASGGPERQMYEVLLRGHERLVRRTELGHLKDRRNGRPEIGWWLFGQWAGRQPGRLGDLLADLDADPAGLGVVLDPELLSRLLASVHARPKELFDPARPEHLRADAFQLDFYGRDFQSMRERLVGPLFAVAHGMAIEVTQLPSVIVRHVGIPDPLDTARLLTTVRSASWQPRGEGLGLKAGCGHPAVAAALTEHTHQLESLLRTVRRAGDPALSALPVYTAADEVRELDEQGRAVPVDGVIRFRLDEERVQELLMGENLYRDRSLAIRELYQNALDACRYRRARTQARESFSSYEGRIDFVQGYDRQEGRHYLECRDNGVGMDEVTLSEVFAQAGVRFTDLPRYQEEHREWHSRGITIHPNSRFGIGVLSYFMLADEVRVTTCHMDARGGSPRELTVLISGPGHYFRVRSTGRPGTIGTTVRLYLRDADQAPSCVAVLRRLLGISEFRTTAVQGTQSAQWTPGVLLPRRGGGRSSSLEAHGELLAAPETADGQVVWCERGGAVLVDGIFTEPRVRRGVLADPKEHRGLRGVVVNLMGESRPKRLSVDRTEILDEDVCATVERLVIAALPVLLESGSGLLNARWLAEIADQNPRLADIVTEAAGAAGCELELHGRPAPVAVAGFYPPDAEIVRDPSDDWPRPDRAADNEDPDDSTVLWRLLAHRPHADLAALTRLVPELDEVASVLPALPSDVLLRNRSIRSLSTQHIPPGHVLSIAESLGKPYADVRTRMKELRLEPPQPRDSRSPGDETDLALLSESLRASSGVWLHPRWPVPPGHLVAAHFELDISVREAARRLRAFGFTVPEPEPSADNPDDRMPRLLSRDLDGKNWLVAGDTVPPAHLVQAHFELGLSVEEAARWLRAYGLCVPETGPKANAPGPHTLRLLSSRLAGSSGLDPRSPVPVRHVFHAAAALGRSVPEVIGELQDYGFQLTPGFTFDRRIGDLLGKAEEFGWEAHHWETVEGDGSVPPGLLASVAAARGTSLRELGSWIADLGLRPPDSLPERADAADGVILDHQHVGRGTPLWIRPGSRISPLHVALAALSTRMSPRDVVSRLRSYGIATPTAPFPEEAEPYDPKILRPLRGGPALSPQRPVPVGHVVNASARLRISPRHVVGRLAQYGLATPLDHAPQEPGRYDTELVRVGDGFGNGNGYLSWDEPVPLHHLVAVTSYVSMDVAEARARLTAFGFRVPEFDPDSIDDIDRALCTGRSGTPVLLRKPVPDFLALARATPLPTDELLDRLTRLGANLQRVTDAVRAALPHVPGLVMKPGAGE